MDLQLLTVKMWGQAEPDTYICTFFLPDCSSPLSLLKGSRRACAYAAQMTF